MRDSSAQSQQRSPARSRRLPKSQAKWKALFLDVMEQVDRTAWRKFLLSMLALAAAFVAAVYSSVLAQQGAVAWTTVSASLALLLAGYVAFTAVPYLARRTRLEWLRVSMDYKVTREGVIFILLIFVIAIAGLNTGNNLLYLILSSMLAAILVSGILSLSVLSGVELEVLLPDHVFARRRVPARIQLHNDKKHIPSFSITLSGAGSGPVKSRDLGRENSPRQIRRTLKFVLVGIGIGIPSALLVTVAAYFTMRGYGFRARNLSAFMILYIALVVVAGLILYKISQRRQVKRLAEEEHPAAASKHNRPRRILPHPIYFPFLPGGRSLSRSVELEFPRRGLYRENGFALSTRFPFGFLEKTLRIPVRRDLWVYPAVTPTDEFYDILPLLSGELEAFQKGRGHDLYSIRDMQPTDSARHVDWKASARTLAPKVREFAREDERRLRLILDRGMGKAPDSGRRALFETAVEFCACLAWHFYEVDAQLQFQCGAFETQPTCAGEQIYDVLKFLAAVEPSPEDPLSPGAFGAEENVFRIICTALPRGSVPTALWSRAYFIFFDTLKPFEEVAASSGEGARAPELKRGLANPRGAVPHGTVPSGTVEV